MEEKKYLNLLEEIHGIKTNIKKNEETLKKLKNDVKDRTQITMIKATMKQIKDLESEIEATEIYLEKLENDKNKMFEQLKKYYKTTTETAVKNIQKKKLKELKNYVDKWLTGINNELKKVYDEVPGVEKTTNILKNNVKDRVHLKIQIDYNDLEKKIESLK